AESVGRGDGAGLLKPRELPGGQALLAGFQIPQGAVYGIAGSTRGQEPGEVGAATPCLQLGADALDLAGHAFQRFAIAPIGYALGPASLIPFGNADGDDLRLRLAAAGNGKATANGKALDPD